MPADSLLQIESSRGPAGETQLALSGCIDEHADLSLIRQVGTGTLVLDLSGVQRINSVGVREWIRCMTSIPAQVSVFWERVSPALVAQLGMISNFHGHSRIRSFYAPYFCPTCQSEVCRLLDTSTHFREDSSHAPSQTCDQCAQTLLFDDVEVDYLQAVLQAR